MLLPREDDLSYLFGAQVERYPMSDVGAVDSRLLSKNFQTINIGDFFFFFFFFASENLLLMF